MAGVNRLLPFAAGSAARVITDPAYALLASRTSGFVAGTAASAELNKVWKQTAAVSAMVGQFIADYSGQDADDHDYLLLEQNFTAALANILSASSAPVHYGVAGGSANAITTTVSPAISSLVAGSLFLVRMQTSPTAAVTINVNGYGQTPVIKSGLNQLSGNEWEAGDVVALYYNGAQFQLAGGGTVWASSTTLTVPGQYPSVQAAIAAASLKIISSTAYVTISVASGWQENLSSATGPLYFSHPFGQRLRVVCPALNGPFPTAAELAGKSAAQVVSLIQGRFNVIINAVSTGGLALHSGALNLLSNVAMIGDGTPNYGIKVGDWSSEVGIGAMAVSNVMVHGFGLDNVRAEQTSVIQANNMASTYATRGNYWISHFSTLECNFGNLLAMFGKYGFVPTNYGLIAIDSASGSVDARSNTSHGIYAPTFGQFNALLASAVNLIGNGGYGGWAYADSLINLPGGSGGFTGTTTYSGNSLGDLFAALNSVVANPGGNPGTCSPARNTSGNQNSIILV